MRAGANRREAIRRFEGALEFAFRVEIDHYVLVDFEDVKRLIDAVGGVVVRLDEPLVDPTMHVTRRGLRLKAGRRHLDGATALAFSRSRHSDSDYERSRRQHQVLAATAKRVLERGLAALPALAELAIGRVETDIPLDAAPALFELARRADLRRPKSVVLAPSAFAAPGPIVYTTVLRLEAVRRMFDRAFRPIR
jgi:anionic cell wall polymer biosynthesis LytR-Cps2A-Psr (LCP) family protein